MRGMLQPDRGIGRNAETCTEFNARSGDRGDRDVGIHRPARVRQTYASMKYVEELYRAKVQVVVVDPVGVWSGLRTGADGGKGLDIPILGGQHGDIPLEAGAGKLIAGLVADVILLRRPAQRIFPLVRVRALMMVQGVRFKKGKWCNVSFHPSR